MEIPNIVIMGPMPIIGGLILCEIVALGRYSTNVLGECLKGVEASTTEALKVVRLSKRHKDILAQEQKHIYIAFGGFAAILLISISLIIASYQGTLLTQPSSNTPTVSTAAVANTPPITGGKK